MQTKRDEYWRSIDERLVLFVKATDANHQFNAQESGVAGGHGGRRRGAGRKPGGGISAVKVLRTEARALLADIVGTARDPLLVAIGIAADETKPDALRLEAALGAARYCHPVLSAAAVIHSSRGQGNPAARDRVARFLENLGGQTIDAEIVPTKDGSADTTSAATSQKACDNEGLDQ